MRSRRGVALWVLAAVMAALVAPARAMLTIEITRGAETGIPVAVAPFTWPGPGPLPHDVSAVVAADLARSGLFNVVARDRIQGIPADNRNLPFDRWRATEAEALVIGNVQKLANGRYQVEFRLFDVIRRTQLAGFRYTVGPELLRRTAHQISDIVHEKLTGHPGAFNTRIAYITRAQPASGPPRFLLRVADADGYGPQEIVNSIEPLLSPAWSPDGKQLAYVSFEKKRPILYLQDVATRRREVLADFQGINSAPAWSPDGKRLALTLSRDGNAEIYVLDLATRALTRLTNEPAIDTEPAWSPDGQAIVFTSDRSGQPQIYRVAAAGGTPERLTFEGDYNARASYAPDGKTLTLVSRHNGRYHIAVLQVDNKSLQVLTDSVLDESPTYAPNGRLILYATEVRGRGVLASVSAEGRTRQLYRFDQGDVREPAWSPYNRELQYKE
ncbi:MAG: Tol-Pal system beta propeller repeat protein TolB [Pseudomonadota bacterium]